MKTRTASVAAIALALSALAGTASAGEVLMTLNQRFSGNTNPSGPAPWATAHFVDVAPNTVRLTMTRSATLGSGEFIRSWYFNLTPDISLSSVSAAHAGGLAASSVSIGSNQFRAGGGPFMDVIFNFATSGSARFDRDHTQSIYTFTGTGLTAESFLHRGVGAGNSPNGLFTAAHFQGLPCDESAWVTGTVILVPLPPAAWAGLGGLGLAAGVVAVRRRSHTA